MTSRERRGRSIPLRRAIAALGVIGALGAMTQVPVVSAGFTATADNVDSAFGSASSFCTAPGSTTLPMLADTWAEASQPNRNYGTDNHITVRSHAGDDAYAYIRPDLPAAPRGCTLASAVLRLDEHGFDQRVLRIYRVASTWNDATLTWANKPAGTGTPATGTTTATTWQIDIVGVIQAIYDAGSGANHGFVIQDAAPGSAQRKENKWHTVDDGAPDWPLITYTWV